MSNSKRTLNLKDKDILKKFVKSGGRKGARKDFDVILKKATGAKNG